MRIDMKLIFGAMLLGLIFCQLASAADPDPSWTQWTPEPPCDEIPETPTNWFTAGATLPSGTLINDPMTIQLFDPSLGELKRVDVTVTGCFDQIAIGQTLATYDDEIYVESFGSVQMKLLDGTWISAPWSYTSDIAQVAANLGDPDFEGDSSHTFTLVDLCESKTGTITDPAKLSSYIASAGVTTKDLPTRASGNAAAYGGGNVQVRVNTQASAQVCVTYWYVPCDDGVFCNVPRHRMV